MDAASKDGAATVDAAPPAALLGPVGPEIAGWEATLDGSVCHHRAVTAECTAGWCKIPAGCFVMGSPETEYGRGLNTERLTGVTLTHSFEIAQTEVTQEQWLEVFAVNPTRSAEAIAACMELDCPLTHVTWVEAVQFANALSQRHEPPLASCFTLSDCVGDVGHGMLCASVTLNAPSVYECEGYRLPTEAEWEYAARAGTRTAYYSGDITVTVHGVPDTNLDSIAWYAANDGGRTHRVAQKRPNRWMLYDMLGNVFEWTLDHPVFRDPPGPLVDPESQFQASARRVTKGGRVTNWPDVLRAADWDYPSVEALQGYGFRLVRTLP